MNEELRALRNQKKSIGEEIKLIKRDILHGYARIVELKTEKKALFEQIKELKKGDEQPAE